MCTNITIRTEIDGSAKGPTGWFSVDTAYVSFDHPYHATPDHTLNIDLVNEKQSGVARVAIELSPEAARALVDNINLALAQGAAETGAGGDDVEVIEDGPEREANANPVDGFIRAGVVAHRGLNMEPLPAPPGRERNRYGAGPFARLVMPPLPDAPGLYLWQLDGVVVYVGQTRTPLKKRLGPAGYASISNYNTFARQPGRTNGGQETNCRVNSLANSALAEGRELVIWYRVTDAASAPIEEAAWMKRHGMPAWNRRLQS